LIGDWVIPPALADKPASVMGDPDMPHTYTFIADIGQNLVALGERDDALGRVWHLPSPETRTTRDVVALVYQAAGTGPRLKVTAWQMRALLGLRATPLADAVEHTVRWYRAQPTPSSATDHKGAQHVAPG
jgi:nucleoside-diphosphate-sugar epimerase